MKDEKLFLDIALPADNGYLCQKRYYPVRFVSRIHWHSFIEIEIVLEGTGKYIMEDEEYLLSRGDIWLLSLNDSHQAICDPGLTIINISLNPDELDDKIHNYLSLIHPLHARVPEEKMGRLMHLINELLEEQTHQERFSHLKTTGILNSLVIEIARLSTASVQGPVSNLMQDITAWIQRHHKEEISMKRIANRFSFSPNYLGHIFKEMLGISVNNYITNLRLFNSCQLLINTDSSVQKIAIDSGFKSIEYFNFVFKKHYGLTPTLYRQMARQNNNNRKVVSSYVESSRK